MEPSYFLDQYFGKETIVNEFKQFSFKYNTKLYFNENEIIKILETRIWNDKLTKIVIAELNNMFKFYISKYICCFFNSKINGNLFFGINDDGFIKGIPSKLPITHKMINDMIKKNMNKYLTSDKSKIDFIIKNHVKIYIHKLKIDPVLIEESNIPKMIKDYQNKKNILEKKLKCYQQNKNKWLKLLNKYRSLYLVANTPKIKKELCDYIKENSSIDMSKILIDELNSKKIIDIPKGYILANYKKNNKNIYYWIMKFKDLKIYQICSKKPKKPDISNKFKLNYLISNLTNLNQYFIKDKTIQFYLIKINIDGSNINQDYYYKDPYTKESIFRSRILLNGEPSSVDY